MNSQWNVWRSRSMGFRKFVLFFFFFFFFFLPLSSYSLVNGKWAMRLGEGKMMSYGEWVNKSKREKERKKRKEKKKKPRQAEWWFGASLGSLTSWLRRPDKEGERRGKREICICAPEEGSGWCLLILILEQQSNYTISPGNMHMRVISK